MEVTHPHFNDGGISSRGADQSREMVSQPLKSHEFLAQAMQAASEIMQNGDLEQAELLFTQLIEKAPGWAEAWNKRATVRYYRENLIGSIADIKETLTLEPRHFGALSGLGMIQMHLQDYSQALLTYESLQKIHPNSQDVGRILPALRQQISQQYL